MSIIRLFSKKYQVEMRCSTCFYTDKKCSNDLCTKTARRGDPCTVGNGLKLWKPKYETAT